MAQVGCPLDACLAKSVLNMGYCASGTRQTARFANDTKMKLPERERERAKQDNSMESLNGGEQLHASECPCGRRPSIILLWVLTEAIIPMASNRRLAGTLVRALG